MDTPYTTLIHSVLSATLEEYLLYTVCTMTQMYRWLVTGMILVLDLAMPCCLIPKVYQDILAAQ